jgi:hypothetical protein
MEGPLAEQARQCGTTPERLALDSLRMLFVPAAPETQVNEGTLFEVLSDYIGSISGTTDALSENCAEHFAEGIA